MSHSCGSNTLAGPAVRRDNALATVCECPVRYPPLKTLNLPDKSDSVNDKVSIRLPVSDPSVRLVKTAFLENSAFVPCRKQVVLTNNGENYDFTSDPRIR